MPAILFVLTSTNKTLPGAPTGWYLPEAAHPYYILAPHFDIDFAAPKGSNPPIDEGSVQAFEGDAECVKFLNDEVVKAKLANAKKLADVNPADYVAVFYPGGHGPAIDLPTDAPNIKLASQFYQDGKIVAALCHGPAALVGAVDASGKSIFEGKAFTGFSNAEEQAVGKVEVRTRSSSKGIITHHMRVVQEIPFLLEDKITALGGKYEKAPALWGVSWHFIVVPGSVTDMHCYSQNHVVVDRQIITGQNPASSKSLAKAILKALNQ
ncbi:hypothetical protein H0H81_007916 [Sphagnurus paluster]|uniref:D-lactate dehydratase n=1 Tax=Sphagnurus paluster TaxID=117069 RepID=A0A9P7FVR9_9AGAR|nr:hypothetical protein H0H81_007916 [Sphagnurus paluster]